MDAYKNYTILSCIQEPPAVLNGHFEIITCQKGDQLLKSGFAFSCVHIIIEGNVIIFEETIAGDAGRVVRLYPGELLGEMEILSDHSGCVYSAMVDKDNTRLLKIDKDYFMLWLQIDPKFGLEVTKILAKKMFSTAALLSTYTLDSSLSIFCNYLYEIVSESLVKNNVYTIHQTRKEIAENCRLSVRTINRRILELKTRGLIEIRKGKITVRKDQMEKILELIKND